MSTEGTLTPAHLEKLKRIARQKELRKWQAERRVERMRREMERIAQRVRAQETVDVDFSE